MDGTIIWRVDLDQQDAPIVDRGGTPGTKSYIQELLALSEKLLRLMLARRKFIEWALSVSAP